jgi:hypothetical protein
MVTIVHDPHGSQSPKLSPNAVTHLPALSVHSERGSAGTRELNDGNLTLYLPVIDCHEDLDRPRRIGWHRPFRPSPAGLTGGFPAAARAALRARMRFPTLRP